MGFLQTVRPGPGQQQKNQRRGGLATSGRSLSGFRGIMSVLLLGGLLLFAGPLLMSSRAEAGNQGQQGSTPDRNWKKITIPGAKCGDGAPYHVYLRKGKEDHLALGLMSGGACWNFSTCYGPTPHTWIHPLPFMLPSTGILSRDAKTGPLWDYTHLYFPYCTGDVFLGRHVATYFAGAKVHHVGRINVELALDYLADNHHVNFSSLEKVVVHGSSAGAIGAMGLVNVIDSQLASGADKTLLVDSPGLHFGKGFWKKFSKKLIEDFRYSFQQMDMDLDEQSGHVASQLPQFCAQLPHWRIGFLQGSKDIVMSSIFGSISPAEHDRLVFGPDGLVNLTSDPTDQCSSWVPVSHFHTFLLTHHSMKFSIQGKSADSYVRDLVQGGGQESYHGRMKSQTL